jgi:hypothetical protein
VIRRLTAASYVVLAGVLAWTRFAGLERGYCCDEISTVAAYVRRGPEAIFVGEYLPNNHQLFSFLAWGTTELVGESEIALRLWSVIPFVVGVAIVTAWLHVRLDALTGVLYLFLATLSPLLIDITRQARGYGLTFLAMSALLVAALELDRGGRRRLVAAFCTAGTVGSLTLPHFTVVFITTGVILAMRPELRRPCVAGMVLSVGVIAAWYAPHLGDIRDSASQDYGAPIETWWLHTAPFDHILVPGLVLLDEAFIRPTLLSLVWAAGLTALMVSSPLLRAWRTALIVCSGTVATLLVLWLAGPGVVPRFFGFLLVPLFALVASGSASIFARVTSRPAAARTVIAAVTLGIVALSAAPLLVSVPTKPREAQAETAAVIRERVPPSTPVHARMPYSNDLAFHLGRRVVDVDTPQQIASACDQREPIVYVDEPWQTPAPDLPCLRRPGVEHERLEQYTRGGAIDVWFVPPAR